MIIALAIIFAAIQVSMVFSIWSINNHAKKQTATSIAQVRLLSKLAKNAGVDIDEVNSILEPLNK